MPVGRLRYFVLREEHREIMRSLDEIQNEAEAVPIWRFFKYLRISREWERRLGRLHENTRQLNEALWHPDVREEDIFADANKYEGR